MSIHASREERRQLERDNAKQPLSLFQIPRDTWPERIPSGIVEVWRSRNFLVQVYAEPNGVQRLTISRTAMKGERWVDGISWDDLQRLKRECGRGHLDAVEVFPADRDVVNVANMRHLWLLTDPLPFCWRRST